MRKNPYFFDWMRDRGKTLAPLPLLESSVEKDGTVIDCTDYIDILFQCSPCSTLSSSPTLPAGVRAPSAGESNFHEYLRPQPLNYFSKPCLNLSSIFLDMCMLRSLCSVIFFSGGTGSTNRNGTCYTVNECSSRGGTSSGSCAAG